MAPVPEAQKPATASSPSVSNAEIRDILLNLTERIKLIQDALIIVCSPDSSDGIGAMGALRSNHPVLENNIGERFRLWAAEREKEVLGN